MNANQIVQILQSRKGQNLRAVWRRPMKTRKGVDVLLEKETSVLVRGGIDYANLGAVQSGIATGERGEVEPLPWGEWTAFPFIIAHKGVDYVRLYPSSFANNRPVVRYFAGGTPTNDIESLKALCLASEFSSDDSAPSCFTLKAENIISIG